MAISLYRKYRPQTFDDVVGQEHVERTLRNALADDHVSHAYLFTGPRGTGKTTTARLLAKALLCEKGPTPNPCGVCDQCKAIADGTHPDVYELDAASRTGVENVRDEIISRVAFAPTRGRYKVYIIDEVHMLSTPAFNALLKTIEEPPDHVVFILCTTDPHTVPDTVMSRCQRFDFHRISVSEIVGNLRYICEQENIAADDASLELIAKHSSGGMRDAITTLEQLAVFTNSTITYVDTEGLLGEVEQTQLSDIAKLVAARDVRGCFKWVASFVESGTDLAQFSRDMTGHLRDLYVALLTDGQAGVEGATPEEMAALVEEARLFGGSDRLARALTIMADLNAQLRSSTDQRLSLELAFVRMARPESDLTLDSLAERIERLEKGGVMAAQPVVSSAEMPSAKVERNDSKPERKQERQATAPKVENSGEAAPVVDSKTGHGATAADAIIDSAHDETPALVADTEDAPSAHVPVKLDTSSAQRIWAAAAEAIKTGKPSMGGAIALARPLFEKDAMVIELPYGSSFSKSMLDEPDNHDFISQCLDAAAGGEVPFSITVSQKQPTGSFAPVREATPQPDNPDPFEPSETVPQGDPSLDSVPIGQPFEGAPAEDLPPTIDEPDYADLPVLDPIEPVDIDEIVAEETAAQEAGGQPAGKSAAQDGLEDLLTMSFGGVASIIEEPAGKTGEEPVDDFEDDTDDKDE